MAAPSYTTDLLTINLAQDTGSWDELDDWAGGGTIYTDETDYYIQGGNCSSQLATKTGAQDETSLIVDYGSDLSSSFTAGETCVFMWHVFLPANALDTFANGGTRLIVGADIVEFDAWKTGGKDFGRNPYGGWQNVAVDPSFTPDYQDDGAVGNGGVYRWFGGGVYLLAAISKGAPHGVDAIRYGRGDLIVTLGEGGNYSTFVGMAAENDDPDLRWGLFQEQAGGYLWKGLISLGTATTFVQFVDSNRNITIDDTPRTYASFNRIEINHNNSIVSWTGINITALNPDGLSIGELEVTADVDLTFDTCVFTDMGIFTFDSTASSQNLLSSTWRRCEQVTQGLATFDNCIFEGSDSTNSLYVSYLESITDCAFFSDGSNHAMELDSNHAGGSFTLLNCTYTDYAESDGSTGNECIYNNSGGHVTINVSGGDVPTIRNGAGSTTTVIASIVWSFEIKNASNEIVAGSEFRIYNSGTQTQVFGVETSDGTEVYSFDQSLAGNNVDVVVHTVDEYLYFRQTLARPTSNTTTVLVLAVDRWYSNEATTKTRTWGGRLTDDFQAIIDSYINSNNPTTPYGSDVDLKLASDIGEIDQTLFDPNITTIPIGATINTAKLYFYIHTNTYTTARDLTTYPLKRDWVESQATWNIYSTGNSWQDPGALGVNDRGLADAPQTNVTAGQTGWVSMDVSDSLQDYYDETIPIFYGWIITFGGGGAGESLLIHSREYLTDKTLRPYLEVNYTT
jgi:hypothetical protein